MPGFFNLIISSGGYDKDAIINITTGAFIELAPNNFRSQVTFYDSTA